MTNGSELNTSQSIRPKTSLSPQLRALSVRLLLSYLGAMGAVVSLSTIATYHIVAHTLYQRVDQQLAILAEAAAHTLPEVLADQDEETRSPLLSMDDDDDLDIPWQNIRQEHQSIEWFDAQGQLITRTGKYLADRPLDPQERPQQDDDVRFLTVPVYRSSINLFDETDQDQELQGYVRVSEWMEDEEDELERVFTGMLWGGGIAVVLIGVTGWWLTQRSLQPIERSFRQLQQFTADASHELRSPLTAVRTAVEVMQSHPERIHVSDVSKLDAIASATRQMGELVDDLLLLARADTCASTVRSGLFIPLNEVLEDLIDDLQSQAIANGVTLTLADCPEANVRGDANQLKRLFRNLIENAVSYTPDGGDVIVVLSYAHSPYEQIQVHVRDTGIGIAPEHLPLVFDRFWRADQARSRREGGSGLGLAIAQAIAQSHGGSIQVRSELGVGSCFQVILPKA
ncbi:MAG: HAMP domain-containing histidine kinase [Synechococcales cyanobacterium T60_A2020_003]|nr:HAMP domain-containing histidine kinase [Synechococcales cyanobacterium T60_A2020_003]